MKVFMLGWEFPPFISGGLGTACYGLTKAMDKLGTKVTFVLPKLVDVGSGTHVNLLTPASLSAESRTSIEESFTIKTFKNVSFRQINSTLKPYETPDIYQQRIEETLRLKQSTNKTLTSSFSDPANDKQINADYTGDMRFEIHRYAAVAAELAKNDDCDIIHAHDWMTYPAAIAVAAVTGKPLIVQVHSTEFDRSGEHVNQMIYDIERKGMHVADKIIAVSNLTRNIIISRYGISPEKVTVVHNGTERIGRTTWALEETGIKNDEKIVLFLGRITMQKGPEYFLTAAKKVLEVMDNVKFVMAGSGDLMQKAVEMAAGLGIGNKVLFTGFLRGNDVQKIYQMADLFVMPSVSEPFGLVPLEALHNDVPVIISKQSGVAEVLSHALKVDFWDTDEIANQIVAVLKYPALKTTLQSHGNFEARKLRWKDAAVKCAEIYEQTLVAC
jgi:glycogen(starch) synthase